MYMFTSKPFGERDDNIENIKARMKICSKRTKALQFRKMNYNSIWETCWTKLISVCINRKLCDVSTSEIYYPVVCV